MRYRHVKGIRWIVCLIFVFLLLTETAAASEDAGTERDLTDALAEGNGYSAVIYNNSNGLPTSEANAIAQTSEGFIWIGSYSGLVRYDGRTFERMDSTSGVANVVCLMVDSKDRLWIGTNDNGLAMMEHGELRMWGAEDGLESAKVCCIEEGTDGTVYVGTTSGIIMITPEMEIRFPEDPEIAHIYTEELVRGSDGRIYGISNEDDYFILNNGSMVQLVDHEENRIQGITAVLPDRNNPRLVYYGTKGSWMFHGNPELDPDRGEFVDIAPLSNVIELRQIGDEIWICANNGIGMLDGSGFHAFTDLPLNNRVGEAFEDYEGNMWFTSSRQGVMKLVKNPFQDIFGKYGLPANVVNSTCMYEDRLWIATDTGLLVLDENGPVSEIPLTSVRSAAGVQLEGTDLLSFLEGTRIRSIIRDSRGRLWIATWRGRGLLCYDQGEVTVYGRADGLFSEQVRIVYETDDGALLVVNTGGLSVIRDDQVTVNYGKESGIANSEILTAVSAPNGDIILGSNGDGIYVINEEGTRRIGIDEGLTSETVMRIKKDLERDIYWIVTSNSICYMDTEYRVIPIWKFPYSNNFDLYENSKGDMWVLSSNGIYVVSVEEMLKNREIRPVHYGLANGMPCISTSNSYSELTPEGDLYLAGSSGVAKFNIEEPIENVTNLRQAVPYIDVDGIRMYPDKDGAFNIASGVQKLTIYGYVYNYSLTDPKVTYRLEGFDREAVTVNRSELDPVLYTNLPGGSYTFVMELKDAMGRGEKKLSIPINKEKALHERTWFIILTMLLAAAVTVFMIWTYFRHKARAVIARHREENERQRISNELGTAKQIQESMLPHVFPPFPDRKEFELYASMDPAREVGGDFYDFFLIDEDHLCLVIADVSGKGIPAALFMMMVMTTVRNNARPGQSAAGILTKTNQAVCGNNQAEMFVTIWLGILEISTGKITAANAGHEYPAVMQNGRFELLKDPHGLVLGGMEGIRYKEYDVVLKPGETLFVYTDGVPEATASENRMFGTDAMLNALNKAPGAAPYQVLKIVRRAVDEFVQDTEQFDDLTMLCIKYHGKE